MCEQLLFLNGHIETRVHQRLLCMFISHFAPVLNVCVPDQLSP